MDWLELLLALAAFFAAHRLPKALGFKAAMQHWGLLRVYFLFYSLMSLALLAWSLGAADRAPFVPLWGLAPWHPWVVNIAMPAACLLAAYGIAAPNPFAFEGRASGFRPEAPGIAGLTRQPLLWALTLWSGSHLLANGDLAHVLLFGPAFAFALLGGWALERRQRAEIGPRWSTLSQKTAFLPGAALLTGRWRPRHWPSLPRLVAALAAWAALLHLHAPAIGASPFP